MFNIYTEAVIFLIFTHGSSYIFNHNFENNSNIFRNVFLNAHENICIFIIYMYISDKVEHFQTLNDT